MDLKEQFEATIEKAKSLSSQSNETLLELYSLYKQATEGDVQGGGAVGLRFPRCRQVCRVGEAARDVGRRSHAGVH